MSKEKIFKYPDPDKIQINESDLKLKFKEYQEATTKRVSFFDLFVIIPAWFPIFNSEFKTIFGISGTQIFGAYTAIVILGTAFWFFMVRNSFIRIWKNKIKKDESWLKLNQADPYKKVSDIKNEAK